MQNIKTRMICNGLWSTVLGAILLACGGRSAESTSVHTDVKPRKTTDAAAPLKTTPADKSHSETEWLAILMEGHKSGYLKSTRTVFADRVVTEVTTSMEMRRNTLTIPIVTVSKTTETADGKPLKIEKRIRGAGMDQNVSGTVSSDGVLHLTTESAGQITSREMDWPKGALMNEGQRLEEMRYGLSEGTTYTSKYFDADLLDAIDVEVHVGPREPVDLFGRVVTGTKVFLKMGFRGTSSDMMMVVDDEMKTLLSESFQMGMKIETTSCTEQYAKSSNDPLEMIRAAFVDAPESLSKLRRQAPLTYTIRLVDKALGLPIMSTDEQSATQQGDERIVTVTKQESSFGAELRYSGDDATALSALRPNSWIQSDAEEIEQLAKKAVADAKDAYTAGLNIERFVADYIDEKNLSVGYASALETARAKQGDCTEHALLTAALCRASGIPAQIVFGLVYVEHFGSDTDLFGGHAWTRIFADGKWVSLDAALGGFDTGHIALAISNGDPSDFFQIIDWVGNLEIVKVK